MNFINIEYKAILGLLFISFAFRAAEINIKSNSPQFSQNELSAPKFTIQSGIASWYGEPFHGRLTANGEIYDMNVLTAAHKTLPFDSLVKVTNLLNDESIIVRINDRGPYIMGRNIDLSYQAAKELNMVGSGVIPVKMQILAATSKFVYRASKYSQITSTNR